MIKPRIVTFRRGPSDRLKSIASHLTAIDRGEVYVWDGGEDPNLFVHAKSALEELSDDQRAQEKSHMQSCLSRAKPMSLTVASHATGIPEWRVNAWYQLIALGDV